MDPPVPSTTPVALDQPQPQPQPHPQQSIPIDNLPNSCPPLPFTQSTHRRLIPHNSPTTLSTLTQRISSSLRRPQILDEDEDNKKRRMSVWAVFGAVMDQESFSRTMSDHQHHHLPISPSPPPPSMSNTPNPNSLNRRSPSRLLSPTREVFDEPDNLIPSHLVQPIDPIDHSTRTEDHSHSYSTSTQFPHQPLKTLLSQIIRILRSLLNSLPTAFRRDFRVILKCSIAYLIASLFSFYDPLSDLLAYPFGLKHPFSGAHVIATIVTYYRPAATVGAMMEANHYAIWGLFWLAVIIVGSTLTSVLIENRFISHAIVLIVFVGFGYGSMAWVKLKSPGFASTCSMIIVISSVIITKEGSIHFGYLDFKKSLIYTEVILIGMLISNLTCIGFWKASATDKLQSDINNTLDSFATLIGMLTKTFLLDETIYTDQEQLKRAVDRHHSSFTSLKQSLNAAVYEFFEPRIQRSQEHYKELVLSMNRLAQHLTGLRSGCSLQYELLGSLHFQPPIPNPNDLSKPTGSPDRQPMKEVFGAFCEVVGPSLKTLMATGMACLHAIKKTSTPLEQTTPFNLRDPELGDRIDEIMHMRSQLSLAIQVFQDSHSMAMKNLCQTFISTANTATTATTHHSSPSQPDVLDTHSNFELNEEIFVICFFLFNMEEFMIELCHLLEIFADIRSDEEVIFYQSQLRWKRFRRRLNITNWFKKSGIHGYTDHISHKPRPRRQRPKLTAVLPLNPKVQRTFPTFHQLNHQRNQQGEQNFSIITSSLDKTKRAIYDFSQSLKDPDVKTAIKIGVGAAILTFPAFWDLTRPTFHRYRFQWAIVTYMIVMAATLGQTNFLVVTRMLGTLIGSGVAILVQYSFWQNPIVLPIIGFLYSMPCFYLIVSRPPYASIGRFLLLSYNLVCVYSYNVRDSNVHILVTAYNRILSVTLGVLFGWMINSFIWPYKARRELRKCLSEFLLESAFLYSFLVKQYSTKPIVTVEEEEDNTTVTAAEDQGLEEINERSCLLNHSTKAQLKSRIDQFSKMEMFLQVKLIRLFELLSATRHEPRFKGPFPKERYRRMLNASQSMIDMLHSLRAVTVREEWFTKKIKEDFLMIAKTEHRELVGNLILFYGLLSSSIELKSPLPPYLPPASQSRIRFLNRIILYRSQSQSQSQSSHLNHSNDHLTMHPSSKSGNRSSSFPTSIEAMKAKTNESIETTSATNGKNINDDDDNHHKSTNPEKNTRDDDDLLLLPRSNRSNVNYSLFYAFTVALKHILIQLEIIGLEAQSLFGFIGGIQNLSEFDEIFSSCS